MDGGISIKTKLLKNLLKYIKKEKIFELVILINV